MLKSKNNKNMSSIVRLEKLTNLFNRPMTLAAGSQIISSLTNFIFTLSLVANLTPSAFGLYSISFAVALAGTAIHQGFFQLQMVTGLSNLDSNSKRNFASALFLAQLTATAIISLPAIVLIGRFFQQDDNWQLAVATALAITGLSGKEFVIRYLFASSTASLWIPALNIISAVTLLVMVISGEITQNPQNSMMGYALAQIAAMVLGFWAAKLTLNPKCIWESCRRIATSGMWGAFSAATYSLRSSAHTFIVGATLPLADVGQMNAARTILTPATLMIPALSAVTLPQLSQTMINDSNRAVRQQAWRIGVGLSVIVVIYAALLLLAWPLLVEHVLGNEFSGLGTYVALWSGFALLIAIRNVNEWALQAMQSFRSLSSYNLLATTLTIAAVAVMTQAWGVIGAIFGLMIGELFLIGLISGSLLISKV